VDNLTLQAAHGHSLLPDNQLALPDFPHLELVQPGDSGKRTYSDYTLLPTDHHPVAFYLASLAKGSHRTMLTALEQIAAIITQGSMSAMQFPWGNLRAPHVMRVRGIIVERYAPSTAKRMISALKGVLKAAWRLKLMPNKAYLRAIDIPPVRGQSVMRGRALTVKEIEALFTACAHLPEVEQGRGVSAKGAAILAHAARIHSARDTALLAVLVGVGQRRREAVHLMLDDYDRESGSITTERGKGNVSRIGYAGAGVRAALDAWLELRGTEPGPLFLPLTRSGRILWRAMNDQAVMDILIKRAREAGLSDRVSPHDLRRTFATNLQIEGVDMATISRMMGHKNIATTMRYDLRDETAKKKAAETLRIPLRAAS
jgi:integrase